MTLFKIVIPKRIIETNRSACIRRQIPTAINRIEYSNQTTESANCCKFIRRLSSPGTSGEIAPCFNKNIPLSKKNSCLTRYQIENQQNNGSSEDTAICNLTSLIILAKKNRQTFAKCLKIYAFRPSIIMSITWEINLSLSTQGKSG